MRTVLFCSLFLFIANNSIAQTSTSDNSAIHIRQGTSYYYIDGIKVRGGRDIPEKSVEEPSTITDTLNKQGAVNTIDFDMDKIKKDSHLIQLVKSDSEIVLVTIEVITGGLPGIYGDLNSSLIQVNTTPVLTIPGRRTSVKEQKMATE
jgi:hypothetical protein